MSAKVITRFAPSPTGELHIGGARTALFSYLFAKRNNGKFLLRIEDTDRERYVAGAEKRIIEALDWLGLKPDNHKNIMIQSSRLDVYKKFAFELLKSKNAYICTCSKEKLEKDRERQIKEKLAPRYEGHCREKEINLNDIKNGEYVIRIKIPKEGKIVVPDLIRGDAEFDLSLFDDQILLKSDGYPTYHLASVVDDHEMGISHVIRAEEWLPSTPKHMILYQMFGWEIPKFAHLPMILAPDKSKLSKRHGATGVFEFKNLGYLPEALINFIALLGWHPQKDREILSFEEILEEFGIDRVQKGGAIFDIKKLNWLNAHYIKEKNSKELLKMIGDLYGEDLIENKSLALKILDIGKGRLEKLSDFKNLRESFDLTDYDKKLLIWGDSKLENISVNLKKIKKILENFPDKKFNKKELEIELMPLADEIGRGVVLWPFRAALSGKDKSPGPFEIMDIIGREESLKRIDIAINKIEIGD